MPSQIFSDDKKGSKSRKVPDRRTGLNVNKLQGYVKCGINMTGGRYLRLLTKKDARKENRGKERDKG